MKSPKLSIPNDQKYLYNLFKTILLSIKSITKKKKSMNVINVEPNLIKELDSYLNHEIVFR